jgi:hypothetical protein
VGIMVDNEKRGKIVEYSIVFFVAIVVLSAFPQTRNVVDKVMEVLSEKVVSSLGGVEE